MQTGKLSSGSSDPLIVATSFVVVSVFFFAAFLRWGGLSFSIKPAEIMNVLSPLVLTAGFVERAVEVIISPLRDTGANKLQNALDTAKAAVPPVAAMIQTANEGLQEYKRTTQRYAFATSLTMSLAIGIAGVRTLWPFLDSVKFGSISPTQQHYFVVVDVVLTVALLAGGADGIHSVVEAFTSFFNASAKKAQQTAA
jgi:hypothetical protein